MLKDGIEFYYNIFDNPQNVIDEINKYEWVKPLNVNPSDRSNSVIYFIDSSNVIFDIVNENIKKYISEYESLYFIPELTYFTIEALKYEPGEHYVMHHDSGSKKVAHRAVSCVIYLNDDYEGGEIEFINFNKKIKPVKNSMVLFPSNYPYLHVAHKVLSGTRYAINIFLEYK